MKRSRLKFCSQVVFAGMLLIVFLSAFNTGSADDTRFDLVIKGGQVIDPESSLNAVRNIAIHADKIVAITADELDAERVIDASGLVVAPGFIDLHSHGQQLPAARMQAFDGVTTALELELGLLPIDVYYANVEAEGRPINFGASASWATARQAVMDGLEPQPSIQAFQNAAAHTNWSTQIADAEQISRIEDLTRDALNQGALGIGFNVGYAPPSGRKEYYQLNKLAAEFKVGTFTHVRYISVEEPLSSFEAFEEVVAVAAATGTRMHIAHVNSTAMRDANLVIDLLRSAQRQGVPITVEAYPYSAASTVIGAAMFRGDNWQDRLGGVQISDFSYGGETLAARSFANLQKKDPGAIIVYRYLRPDTSPADQQTLDDYLLYPGGALASDAMPWIKGGEILEGDIWPIPVDAFAHPRSAGTFSRFLRIYVREQQKLSLAEAIRKSSLIPAQILEPFVPQMRSKGRLAPGMDADIVVFNPDTISDQASFEQPAQTSIGMQWVIVAGVPIIESGLLQRDRLPGRAIRRTGRILEP